MKFLAAATAAACLFASTHAFSDSDFSTCNAALDPNLKSVMESSDYDSFANAFSTFYKSSAGQSWSKSGGGGGSLSVDIAGILSLGGSGHGSNSNSGSTTQSSETANNGQLAKTHMSNIRNSLTSADQWHAYETCIGAVLQSSTLVSAKLSFLGQSKTKVKLTVTRNFPSDAILAPIVTRFKILGAKAGSYDDWSNVVLHSNMDQIFETDSSDSTVAVEINTTLGPATDSLDAPTVAPTTPQVTINKPACTICAGGPMLSSAACAGEVMMYWRYKLASHGLSTADASDQPIFYRKILAEAQCRQATGNGRLQVVLPPPPPAPPGLIVRPIPMQMPSPQQLVQIIDDGKRAEVMAKTKLAQYGDKYFEDEMPPLPDLAAIQSWYSFQPQQSGPGYPWTFPDSSLVQVLQPLMSQ